MLVEVHSRCPPVTHREIDWEGRVPVSEQHLYGHCGPQEPIPVLGLTAATEMRAPAPAPAPSATPITIVIFVSVATTAGAHILVVT